MEMDAKQQYIHSKGFDITHPQERLRTVDGTLEYGSIKVGTKTLEDAILDLGSLRTSNRIYCDKAFIFKAIAERNYPLMREISNYFYNTNGIYSRVCDYYAKLFRYDWYVVPEVYEENLTEKLQSKLNEDFNMILNYLDNSHIKKICGDIALKVIVNGAYYGYITEASDKVAFQELPISYCRTRFYVKDNPVVEFNMRFFDEKFRDVNYRLKILKMFPKEIQKGYMLYKQGKLTADVCGDDPPYMRAGIVPQCLDRSSGWYPLEPGSTV